MAIQARESSYRDSHQRLAYCLAWAVHFYTALGAVLGLLTIELSAAHDFRAAFFMMALATIIDSSDGPLARKLEIKRRVPDFDGALLDNIVDYLTYVIAPCFLLVSADMLPAGALGAVSAGALVLSSAFGFCQVNAKTPDHYFLGFPSYWNLVALYLYCFGWGRNANAAIVLGFAVLVFIPIKYIYPNRTELLRRLTLVLAIIWAILIGAILFTLPRPNPILVWISFSFIGYYLIMSFALHARSALIAYRARQAATSPTAAPSRDDGSSRPPTAIK